MICHIDVLCAAGLLIKQTRQGPNGKRSNVYMLALDSESPAHPDVQGIHMVCAAVAQTHSAGAAHRISHSLDPVIDPKSPPISPPGGSMLPKAQLHDEELVCRMTGSFLRSGGRWASQETGWPRERILLEAATFADYWQSLPGAKATKLDWEKTWRNWVRRAASSFRTAAQRKPLANLQAAQNAAQALR